MLSKESSSYFLLRLTDISDDSSLNLRQKTLRLRSVLREICNTVTSSENQLFSSLFSKIIFVIDKFSIPEGLADKLKHFRSFCGKLTKNKNLLVDEKLYNSFKVTLRNAIHLLSDEESDELKIENNLSFNSTEVLSKKPVNDEIVRFIRCVVKWKPLFRSIGGNPKKVAELICETDEYGIVKIQVTGLWLDWLGLIWENAVMNIFDIKVSVDKSGKTNLITTQNSLIILEPDYLVDVTELSECFQMNGANENLFFISKLIPKKTSLDAIAGNLVNHCFDELINSPEMDFETVWYNGIKIKPLQIFSAAAKNKENVTAIKNRVGQQFINIKNSLSLINYDEISLEPTFISPDYGLQGRLDALLEFNEEPGRKNIIELKSGKFPKPEYSIKNYDGNIVRAGIWNSNFAQVSCYNLLLDSSFPNRSGSSRIFYSKAQATEHPFRNAPNIIQKKQEVLSARNKIICFEHQLSSGDFRLFEKLKSKNAGEIPSYMSDDLAEFILTHSSLSSLEKIYFEYTVSFVFNEIRSSKLGAGTSFSDNGFSGLWKDSPEEKQVSMNILSGLELIMDKSDLEFLHLRFRRSDDYSDTTSIRKGDLTILYKNSDGNETGFLSQQMLKCSIKDIDRRYVTVSIRNKQLRKNYFSGDNKWTIEPDMLDNLNKILLSSLYEFVRSDKSKKDLVLGLREPEFNDIEESKSPDLNDEQRQLLSKCLAAKDYFLIQGPPGTGKTSYMLKSIVEEIYNTTGETILVMAYTNRAVDEICNALKKIVDLDFIRLGSKESTEHSDVHLAALAESVNFNQLYKQLRKTRVIVSTVSSALSNYEIFEIKTFDTAIIDEAAQISEPQLLGILAKVKRFIMIGDEKQLPAIILQNTSGKSEQFKSLSAIEYIYPGISLFERLLRCCKKNGWSSAFGNLTKQARMHSEIQNFVNIMFYNNQLTLLDQSGWQTEKLKFIPDVHSSSLEELILSNRIVFIETKIETGIKINRAEAVKVSEIINIFLKFYKDNFNENTVGVITPFRAQCSEIKSKLDEDIRNLVTVDTVERFQGSERDVIIISFACNNVFLLRNIQSITKIDGITIDRKLNVAMTRARQHLILLGCKEILCQADIFRKLFEYPGLSC